MLCISLGIPESRLKGEQLELIHPCLKLFRIQDLLCLVYSILDLSSLHCNPFPTRRCSQRGLAWYNFHAPGKMHREMNLSCQSWSAVILIRAQAPCSACCKALCQPAWQHYVEVMISRCMPRQIVHAPSTGAYTAPRVPAALDQGAVVNPIQSAAVICGTRSHVTNNKYT